MNKFNFLKISLLFIAISVLSLNSALYAQHLFSISHNNLSRENIMQIKNQITNAEISTLSLTRNNEQKDVFSVTLSSIPNTQLIILNEQTGNHVIITPVEVSLAEFQLAPFFLEELKQSVLGTADRYLLVEATSNLSLQNVVAVFAPTENVYIPRYFYGKKENVKEALPKDREIMYIFKEKPEFMPAFPDDPENQLYIEQLEEEMSYYVYMYKLPDGTLTIYDEHFNPDENVLIHTKGNRANNNLEFILSGNLNPTQVSATEWAFTLWGEQLGGWVPLDININSTNMGTGGVIGASYRMQNFFNAENNTWYPSSLWNQLVGYDATTNRDIKLEMNTPNMNFFYGLSGNPSAYQIDWVTVMLHEVSHGLGFFPLVGSDGRFSYATAGGGGSYTDYPGIYDRQLFQGTSGPCMADLNQTDRAALVKSANLYAGAPGSNLLTANNNARVKIYAPTTYSSGSSVSHWDSYQTFTTFMKYYIDNGVRITSFNTRKIGLMLDMGWTLPQDLTDAIFVFYNANSGEGTMAKHLFTSGVAQNLRPNIFTRVGYTYINWNSAQDGTGVSYEDKASVTISEDLELFAQWSANTYTITFNPNGGTVNPTTKQVTYDAPVGELPIPVKEGYVFNAWKYGPTTFTEETIWTYAQSLTLTASWVQPANYTITAVAGEGGTISPSGTVKVEEGSSKLFTITPNEKFEIEEVLVDNISVGAVSEYLFENIVASHTILAKFTPTDGISENQRNAPIQITPNPASNSIELRITNYELQMNEIDFYNIFGQLVKTVPAKGVETQKIDISHLTAGIYFVKVAGSTVKLVVN